MSNGLAQRFRQYVRVRGPADALRLAISSAVQLLRGLARGYWPVFIGRHVVIRARRQVRIGRFTRIEDYCELDGFGRSGLMIGAFCKLGKFSTLRVPPVPHEAGEGIAIGDGTTFAEYCFVGGAGPVRIGERNAFGQYVSVHPQNHLPFEASGVARTSSSGIAIGDDNWFGAKATLLDGASVGSRCIVAAAAVVRGALGSDVLAAGVPAEIKRSLNTPAGS